MPRLDVRVVSASNLPEIQTVGKIDPYCKVALGDVSYKTPTIEDSTNPEWNHDFKFTIADPDSTRVKFTIWNENNVSDDFLGEYALALAGLVRGQPKEVTALLQQCKSNAELKVVVTAVDFGPDPPPPVAMMPPPQLQQQQHSPPPPSAGMPPMPAGPGYVPPPPQPVMPPQPPRDPDGLIDWLRTRPFLLRSCHGNYVTAQPGVEGAPVDAEKNAGPHSVFYIDPAPNDTFVLRSWAGVALRAQPGVDGVVDVQTKPPRDWERFRIREAAGSMPHQRKLILESHHGTFVRVGPASSKGFLNVKPVHGKVDLSSKAAEWETLTAVDAREMLQRPPFITKVGFDGDTAPHLPPALFNVPVHLHSFQRSHLTAASGTTGAQLKLSSEQPGSHGSHFYFVPCGSGYVFIRTDHGQHLRGHPGGSGALVDLQHLPPQEWEAWRVVQRPDRSVNIRSAQHGTYLRVGPTGNVELSSDIPGGPESWFVQPCGPAPVTP